MVEQMRLALGDAVKVPVGRVDAVGCCGVGAKVDGADVVGAAVDRDVDAVRALDRAGGATLR